MFQKNKTKWLDSDIYDNTQKEVIVVDPATLDNKLRDFESGIENKREIRHFIELTLALLGVLLTSNFKNFLGIPPNYWFAIFFLALFWSVFRLLSDLIFKKQYPGRDDILKNLMAKNKKSLIKA